VYIYVPLVKLNLDGFPGNVPEYRYLSFFGCATALTLKEGNYHMGTLQQVLTLCDHINVIEHIGFEFKSIQLELVSELE